VDFRAGPTWTDIAHLPKVVLHPEWEQTVRRKSNGMFLGLF
jgi:hypothetical protein